MSSIKTITDNDFKSKVENTDKTVLIGFWSRCSAASRTFEPSLSAAAAELADQAEIYKMDADSNFATTAAYKIAVVPTLLIFKKGKLLSSYVGAVSKGTISQLLAVSL